MTAAEYKAEIARELLENAGIKTVIINQHDSAYQTFGEFHIYVAEQDGKRAVELLKNLKSE